MSLYSEYKEHPDIAVDALVSVYAQHLTILQER